MAIAELGVFTGLFSRELLTCKPEILWLVDIWEGPMSSGVNDNENDVIRIADMSKVYIDIVDEFCYPNVNIYRGRSTDFLQAIEDDSLDCVFIDTDHSFEQTRDELNLSFDKVKSGGWITGHDYNMGGVRDAVDSFCQLNGLEIEYLSKDKFVSYYIKNTK